MGSSLSPEALERLPFWVTAPGDTDGFLIVVGLFLVAVLLGFGALYFTIQAIPDKMAAGAHKVQMQLVGILGLISLFTMNNAFWIAAILVAAVPLHEILPLRTAVEGAASDELEEPESKMEEPALIEGDEEGDTTENKND